VEYVISRYWYERVLFWGLLHQHRKIGGWCFSRLHRPSSRLTEILVGSAKNTGNLSRQLQEIFGSRNNCKRTTTMASIVRSLRPAASRLTVRPSAPWRASSFGVRAFSASRAGRVMLAPNFYLMILIMVQRR